MKIGKNKANKKDKKKYILYVCMYKNRMSAINSSSFSKLFMQHEKISKVR